ncbi:MAG: amidase, partial [Bacteroidota bacterium]
MRTNIYLLLYLVNLTGYSLFAQNSQDSLSIAAYWSGLQFDSAEYQQMEQRIRNTRKSLQALHETHIPNRWAPGFTRPPLRISAGQLPTRQYSIIWDLPVTDLPTTDTEIAFLSTAEQAYLISQRQLSAERLTGIYLERLKQYSDTLQCTITLLEERALQQAQKADKEIAAGQYRGPLHGIPYGIKDLFALEGFPTTWGAAPFKDQQLNQTATVIQKLEDAGAVLVAKLTLGALAMGDVWYGGITKNPWKLEQGSSGSSAGSAAATSAGLVSFAIGTETWGSIISPSTRCGVTGLRPSYGRVSRHGAMALSWTMDKVGPICRTVHDCALVFDAIRGLDGLDPTLIDLPFNYQEPKDIKSLKVGYLLHLFEADYANHEQDKASLDIIRKLGIDPIPLSLDSIQTPVSPLRIILFAEAAAAFDGLTRSNRDSLLVAQRAYSWPNIFRSARFIPAVEYIQAQRLREQLIIEVEAFLQGVDVLVCPTFGGEQLLMTNLTGHPAVVVPNGFREDGSKTSITFVSKLYDEATLLQFAKTFQQATQVHLKHPP